MSFSCKFKTLRIGNSHDSRTQSEMRANESENTGEAEMGIIEGSEENSTGFTSELADEKIKASLEPLHAQITAFAETMDRLIQSNSAKESTTPSSRGIRHQHESPYNEVPESSQFPTVAPLTTAGYSADRCNNKRKKYNKRIKIKHRLAWKQNIVALIFNLKPCIPELKKNS